MINFQGGSDASYGMPATNHAFPRVMVPPTPPRTRGEPRPLNQYHAHMDRPPHTSPIANAIANQILHNHLNQPHVGIAHAAQMGLNDGLHNALVNAGLGSAFGQGGGPLQAPPSSLSSVPVGYQPPTSPFGYTF